MIFYVFNMFIFEMKYFKYFYDVTNFKIKHFID